MTAYPCCIVRFGLTMVKCFHFQLKQLRMESGQLLVFARRLSGPKEEAGVYTSSECLTKRSKLGTLSSGVAVACRILRWICTGHTQVCAPNLSMSVPLSGCANLISPLPPARLSRSFTSVHRLIATAGRPKQE